MKGFFAPDEEFFQKVRIGDDSYQAGIEGDNRKSTNLPSQHKLRGFSESGIVQHRDWVENSGLLHHKRFELVHRAVAMSVDRRRINESEVAIRKHAHELTIFVDNG